MLRYNILSKSLIKKTEINMEGENTVQQNGVFGFLESWVQII